MATPDADRWHQVHAQREDGVAAMFLIRDVEPRADQPQIFVIELPYPVTDLSKLPDATGYRRLDAFQEQWVEPACEALDWTFVAWKSEDGSFFLYLYGDGDPNVLLEKLAPFDGALGFFHDRDADWAEYAALRELVDQAQAAPEDEEEDGDGHVHTDDCDHDHDHDHNHGHGHGHDHDHDHDHTSNGILVIDRTGDRPAGKAKKPRTTKPATAKTTKSKSTSAKPAAKKLAKPAAKKLAKPAAKKLAKPAAKKPAKPAAKKSAPPKTSARKPAKSKRPAPRTSRR